MRWSMWCWPIRRWPASVPPWVYRTAGALECGSLTVSLKPPSERHLTSEEVSRGCADHWKRWQACRRRCSRHRTCAAAAAGRSQYQYAIITQDINALRRWALALEDKLRTTPGIVDVTSDQDRAGPQANVVIDRDAAARLGINTTAIDNALNNAYSQRQISTIYAQRNQYKVVLEIDPRLQADPSMLDRIYVGAAGGKQVPLSAVAHFERGNAPLAVRHPGQFPAATLSFNLAPGLALGDAENAVENAARELRMPEDVRTEFAGNARFLQQSLSTQPLLIAPR